MMTWLQHNWLLVFTIWMAANSVLSHVGEAVPATTWYGKLLHVFVAISPMDVMKAIKTVSGSVVPPGLPPVAGLLLLACLAGSTSACASASPSVPVQTVDPRALARASTALLESAWQASARACLDLANVQHDDTIRQKCEKVLTPARNALLTADSAIDVWGAAEQKNFPCIVGTVALGLINVANVIPSIKLPQIVADALTLAQSYAGRCAP